MFVEICRSNNGIRDLQAGQQVRYAMSDDGLQWGEARAVTPREEHATMRYFARGFWIRHNELFALAAHDEAVRPLFGPGLELLRYRWSDQDLSWVERLVIAEDTINNLPSKPLPSVQWMMSRRDHPVDAYKYTNDAN